MPRASLPADVTLAPEIWALIRRLEAEGQGRRLGAGTPFLPTYPAPMAAGLWSEMAFAPVPDLARFWFGAEGLEDRVMPLVRRGGDGSYLALWHHEWRDR